MEGKNTNIGGRSLSLNYREGIIRKCLM